MKTVLIIGVGQFGSHIARRMEELRCEVMAVDENEKHINDILPYVTNARIGDSTNEEFLRSLGVGNYDVCIVAIGGQFQSSLQTTSLLSRWHFASLQNMHQTAYSTLFIWITITRSTN